MNRQVSGRASHSSLRDRICVTSAMNVANRGQARRGAAALGIRFLLKGIV